MYFADHYSKFFRKGYLIGRAVVLDYAADGKSSYIFIILEDGPIVAPPQSRLVLATKNSQTQASFIFLPSLEMYTWHRSSNSLGALLVLSLIAGA